MLMRPVRKSDFAGISKLFEPWFEHDPSIKEKFQAFLDHKSGPSLTYGNVLDAGGKIIGASFWESCNSKETELLAINCVEDQLDSEFFEQFIHSEIVDSSKRHIEKIVVKCPQRLGKVLPLMLRNVGFVFETLFHQVYHGQDSVVMTKTLEHIAIPAASLVGFLIKKFETYGYEIKLDPEGFSYRVMDVYQRPFIVSKWHRVTFSGNDLIIYPPAKRLEPHELETMFYPLRIVGPDEAPLMVTMEKKRACVLLNIPEEDSFQKNMFGTDSGPLICPMNLNNVTYSIASGHKGLRRGLPILFYVNGLGAVGEARIMDWAVEAVSNLDKKIENYPGIEIDDLDAKAIKGGAKVSQILRIRFNYYRAFHRVISFDEIRNLDVSFNPQRRRFVSNELFESISFLAYRK